MNLSSVHFVFLVLLGSEKSWDQKFANRILTNPQKTSNTNLSRGELEIGFRGRVGAKVEFHLLGRPDFGLATFVKLNQIMRLTAAASLSLFPLTMAARAVTGWLDRFPGDAIVGEATWKPRLRRSFALYLRRAFRNEAGNQHFSEGCIAPGKRLLEGLPEIIEVSMSYGHLTATNGLTSKASRA